MPQLKRLAKQVALMLAVFMLIGIPGLVAQPSNSQLDPLLDMLVHVNNAAKEGWWKWRVPAWDISVYHIGNLALYRALLHAGRPEAGEYLNRSRSWAERHGWNIGPENSFNQDRYADRVAAGQVYIELVEANAGEDDDLDTIRDAVAPRTPEPELHEEGLGEISLWWVDALFMAGPVLSKLGRHDDDTTYFDRLGMMYEHTRDHEGGNGLYNPPSGLWNANKNKPEDEYWLRGNGWAIAAMARILEDLDALSNGRREPYETMLQDMARDLEPLQRNDGFWNVDLSQGNDDKLETSGTALITYALALGIRLGVLNLNKDSYISVVNKAWRGIVCTAIHSDGTLGYVQTAADNPDGGRRTAETTSNFGVGTVLLAGSAIYHLALAEGSVVTFPACTGFPVLEAEDATIHKGKIQDEHAGFSGVGYVNYDNVKGSYVEWPDLGPGITNQAYVLAFRYANGTTSQDRLMDIWVNDTVVAEDLSFLPTGSWPTWAVQTTTTVLQSDDTIKAEAVTSNGGPNVDYLELVAVIEAEDYDRLDGTVDREHAGHTGTGYVNFRNSTDSFAEWTVRAPQAGNYVLTFHYANGSSRDRAMDLEVNGEDTGTSVSFPSTNAWTHWALQRAVIELNAGENTLRMEATIDQGGPNIDHFGISFEHP